MFATFVFATSSIIFTKCRTICGLDLRIKECPTLTVQFVVDPDGGLT